MRIYDARPYGFYIVLRLVLRPWPVWRFGRFPSIWFRRRFAATTLLSQRRSTDLVRAILNGMTLFAVIRTRGRAWLSDRGLEDQPQWREHADFMNGLAEEGFVVLSGPLEGTPDVLLIVRAESAEAISQRLEGDPWAHMELLRILSITPWTVRLGAPPGAA